MYDIREAREEDREQVVSLLTREFKKIDAFEEEWVDSWRNYWFKPEYDDWAYVVTHNDHVVANLAYFVNNGFNNIRGNPLRFGGVWAVATAEEHRRKGLLRGIYDKAFPDMNKRGIVISILDPSPYLGAQITYERMGYALAERQVKHQFPPTALRNVEGCSDISVRELDDPDEKKHVSELEFAMNRYGSRVYSFPDFFVKKIQDGNFFILERDSKPVGCVKLSVGGSSSDKSLKVLHAYFVSEDVLPSILNLISERASDVTQVEWICDSQIPIRNYSQNIKKFKTEHTGSMMMRIVNFEGYCESIRVPENTETKLVLELTDSQCSWNKGVYKLDMADGELNIEKCATGDEELTLNPHQLSLIIGGLVTSPELQAYGLISCSHETALKLDAIFPVDSFISYFRF